MINKILGIFTSILGKSHKTTENGDYAFFCPFCKHKNKKLNINFITYRWHCWVCGVKGRSLFQILKKLNVDKDYVKLLSELVQDKPLFSYDIKSENVAISALPKEFKPLYEKSDSFFYKRALDYVLSRNITINDIFKYNIGYAESGKYDGMIIIPNYNKNGQINYFTTRNYNRVSDNKFKNPTASKNVIGFELQVNWNLPVILTESALDAIVIRRNGVPLYGKTLPESLKLQLIENDTMDIYIALDPDAFNDMIDHAKYFINNGINVYHVDIPTGMDPNQLGYEKMQILIENAKMLTSEYLWELKLKNRIN